MAANRGKKGFFGWVDYITEHTENFVMGFGLISISAIVFVNVIMRYVFNTAFTWSEELSRYIVIWVCFFGISSCARYDGHVTVDLLPNSLKGKAKFIQALVVKVISLAACVYLAYSSILFTLRQYRSGNTSVSIAIPIWIIYLSTSIGFIFISYVYLRKIGALIASRGEERA
jgi:C4-dicarboxylate transporter DctQ subunit